MDLLEEIRSFKPIDIEKISQDSGVSQKVIDSVKSYNKAIENLRTGSEDIAMIELKKVVSVNPDFYEAVNLLGLCYAYTKQLDKAEELFGRVVESENDVLKAADYLRYIVRNEGPGVKANSSRAKKKNVLKTKREKPEIPKEDLPAEYVLFKRIAVLFKKTSVAMVFNVISIICLVAALVFFVQAAKNNDKVIKEPEPSVSTQVNAAYETALKENTELKKQVKDLEAKLNEVKLSQEIAQVSTLYGQKKYPEAADKLLTLDIQAMNEEQKTKYDSMKEDVLSKAANQLTNEGKSLYDSKKYTEAIAKLERVFVYGDKWPFGDKALYHLAKGYSDTQENQKAVAAYQKLIDEYPKSTYIQYAKPRLKALQ